MPRNEIIWWLAGLVLSVLITLAVIALLLRNGLLDAWVPVAGFAALIVFLVTLVVVTRWMERRR